MPWEDWLKRNKAKGLFHSLGEIKKQNKKILEICFEWVYINAILIFLPLIGREIGFFSYPHLWKYCEKNLVTN